jgi:hypothetical protein
MKPTLLLAGLLAGTLTLTACDRVFQRPAETPKAEKPAADAPPADAGPELPVRPEAVEAGTAIDWEAARRDLAARAGESGDAGFSIQSGGDAPPVPVFLPSAPATIASGDAAPRFQPTSDGYYAFFPGEAYDMIVNGTNVVISDPGAAAAPAPRGDAFRFQTTTTGAQVAFSRYGADYLVEFECKDMPGGQASCITDEAALAAARDLALSGTR